MPTPDLGERVERQFRLLRIGQHGGDGEIRYGQPVAGDGVAAFRHGFADVSIDDIMAEAGLTRGGFYNHFGTKDEFYAAVVAQILDGTPASRWSGDQTEACDVIPAFVAAYLSQAHFDNRENCCSLMALPSDVARSGEPVKRAYRQVLEYMVGNLERVVGP